MICNVNLLLTAAVLAASAAPQPNCIITEYSQVDEVVKNCNDIVVKDLTVPPNQTLTLNLTDGTRLEFQGKISFEYFNWKGPLVSINGNQLHVKGAEDHVLYGNGELYWDGLGNKGVAKPTFLQLLETKNSIFEDITLKNCPIECVSVTNCDNITITGWDVNVSEGKKNNYAGHNTKGFILTGNNLLLKNNSIKSQDDCLLIKRGSNIIVSKMYCYGSGLAISMGSGSKKDLESNTAHNILIEDSLVRFSPTGIKNKTESESGEGMLSNVTFKNIRLEKITNYGIKIEQDYIGGEASGVPGTNIPIVGLQMDKVTGYMVSFKDSQTRSSFILCGDGACRDWEFRFVQILAATHDSYCNYVPEGYEC